MTGANFELNYLSYISKSIFKILVANFLILYFLFR